MSHPLRAMPHQQRSLLLLLLVVVVMLHAYACAGAAVSVIEGDALLSAGYPAVHTVGRAAGRPPLLMELRWQPPADDTAAAQGGGLSSAASDVRAPLQGDAASTSLPPLLALVGKGVCFDSGGLDIKTAAGMRLMKKVWMHAVAGQEGTALW